MKKRDMWEYKKVKPKYGEETTKNQNENTYN